MSMFGNPDNHAANPPASWEVVKLSVRTERRWRLQSASGDVLASFTTKRDAEAAKVSGRLTVLYDKERRWYAGESIPNWKPYRELGPRP